MDSKQKTQSNPSYRCTLVRLSTEAAEGLEDVQYQLKRQEHRRVTKRELIEQAVRNLIAQSGQKE